MGVCAPRPERRYAGDPRVFFGVPIDFNHRTLPVRKLLLNEKWGIFKIDPGVQLAGMDPKKTEASMKLIADEVLPHFRKQR